MTPYAASLLAYVQGNMPQGFDCESWLDTNIDPMWRMLTEQPSTGVCLIEDGDEE